MGLEMGCGESERIFWWGVEVGFWKDWGKKARR